MLFLNFIVRFFFSGPAAVQAWAFARTVTPVTSRPLRAVIRPNVQTPPGPVPWLKEPGPAFLSLR